MAEILRMNPASEPIPLHDYPPEHRYVRWGTGASIGVHLFVIAVVLILAWIHHIRSLADLMAGSVAALPPDQIQIILPPDDDTPPPTDHPEWIKQILLVKNQPPPPPPPKHKPKPKQATPIIQHPVAPHPVAQLRVGNGGAPAPRYPMEALRSHIQGTVVASITFDGDGRPADVEIVSSSGSSVLDENTRHWILENWHIPEYAGRITSVPVRYQIPGGG
jgi:TonB family protein